MKAIRWQDLLFPRKKIGRKGSVMLEFVVGLFSDYTARTILLGAASLGIVSGVVGSYAVLRKQSLVGDVMSHRGPSRNSTRLHNSGSQGSAADSLSGPRSPPFLAVFLINLITSNSRIKKRQRDGNGAFCFFRAWPCFFLPKRRECRMPTRRGLISFFFGQAEGAC